MLLAAIRRYGSEKEVKTFEESWRLIVTPPLETSVLYGTCTLSTKDVEYMEATGLIEQISRERCNGAVWLHAEAETAKTRRRFIAWPRQANDGICVKGTEIAPQLATPVSCVESAGKAMSEGKVPVVFDMKAWYHQFSLPQECYSYCFSAKGRFYRLRTIPTGCRPAAGVANIATAILTRIAERALQLDKASVYIDNVRLWCTKDKLSQVASVIKTITARFNAETNETEAEILATAVSATHDFLGLKYDVNKKTIEIGPKVKSKLDFLRTEVEGDKVQRRRLDSIIGVLLFASFAMGLDLSFYYHFFKWNRENLSALADEILIWDSCAKSTIQWWIETIQRSPARKIEEAVASGTTTFLWTDASSSGWGYFYFIPATGANSGFGSHWTAKEREEHINVLEIMAVEKSIRTLKTQSRNIHLRIDNTTALYTTSRGYSSHYKLNQAVATVNDAIRECQCAISTVGYVATQNNPADWWSRLN